MILSFFLLPALTRGLRCQCTTQYVISLEADQLLKSLLDSIPLDGSTEKKDWFRTLKLSKKCERQKERSSKKEGNNLSEWLFIVVYGSVSAITSNSWQNCSPLLLLLLASCTFPRVCPNTKGLLHIQCDWLLYYCLVFSPSCPDRKPCFSSSFSLFSFHRMAIDWRRSAASLFLTSALCVHWIAFNSDPALSINLRQKDGAEPVICHGGHFVRSPRYLLIFISSIWLCASWNPFGTDPFLNGAPKTATTVTPL